MHAKRDAHTNLLAGIDLFAACERKDLQRVAALTTETAAPAGRVLCREGEVGHEAFVIVDGTATVTVGDRQIDAVGPGEMFGEMALLDGGPRIATVTATSPMRLLVLTRPEFHAVLGEVPYVGWHMLTVLGKRLRHFENAHLHPGAPIGV